VRQEVTGTLLFTPEQAKHIQAEAETRMRLQTAEANVRYGFWGLGSGWWLLQYESDGQPVVIVPSKK
jgi:hypothetical protein